MIYSTDEAPSYDNYFYGFLALFTFLGGIFAYAIS